MPLGYYNSPILPPPLGYYNSPILPRHWDITTARYYHVIGILQQLDITTPLGYYNSPILPPPLGYYNSLILPGPKGSLTTARHCHALMRASKGRDITAVRLELYHESILPHLNVSITTTQYCHCFPMRALLWPDITTML